MKPNATGFLTLFLCASSTLPAADLPDIRSVPTDLNVPPLVTDAPGPGKRVRQVMPEYAQTEVFHTLYLPTDWQKDRTYPVLVEYAGNGPYRNKYGDVSTGKVEETVLGYGISGGRGCIWLCLPYISKDHKQNQTQWWGDTDATVRYCIDAVNRICRDYAGDKDRVILCGFSRGSIACNFMGLRNDAIAGLWRGFICHSHYDGVRKWDYEEGDRSSAAVRLKRLNGRPQFISQERSVEETRRYLAEVCPTGAFTFVPLPYRNHTDAWVLRDIPERKAVRDWLQKVVEDPKVTP